jgi:hypothetical protein
MFLFDVGDRLLEDMAEDRDRYLALKVVSRNSAELIGDVIWNG